MAASRTAENRAGSPRGRVYGAERTVACRRGSRNGRRGASPAGANPGIEDAGRNHRMQPGFRERFPSANGSLRSANGRFLGRAAEHDRADSARDPEEDEREPDRVGEHDSGQAVDRGRPGADQCQGH